MISIGEIILVTTGAIFVIFAILDISGRLYLSDMLKINFEISSIIFSIGVLLILAVFFMLGPTMRIIGRILCFIMIPTFLVSIMFMLEEDPDSLIFIPILGAIIVLIIGIFPSTWMFFLNFTLGILWGIIFILIPLLVIGLFTMNIVVKSGMLNSSSRPTGRIHEREANIWERANYSLGGLKYVYIFLAIVGHIVFSMITNFSEHKLYLFFWNCWPFNHLF